MVAIESVLFREGLEPPLHIKSLESALLLFPLVALKGVGGRQIDTWDDFLFMYFHEKEMTGVSMARHRSLRSRQTPMSSIGLGGIAS